MIIIFNNQIELFKADLPSEKVDLLINYAKRLDVRDPDISSDVKAVLNYFKITLDELKGRAKDDQLPQARHVLMYRLMQKYNYTTVRAALFLNRSHASAIYALKQVKGNLSETYKSIFP